MGVWPIVEMLRIELSAVVVVVMLMQTPVPTDAGLVSSAR